jgi:hypothetical protein
MKSPVGRKKTNFEQMPARFPDGTFERIDAVLEPGENRADFLRQAVEREIKRRERSASGRMDGSRNKADGDRVPD